MSSSGHLIALNLDHDRLCAVKAAVSNKGVVIEGWWSRTIPAGVDSRDGKVFGVWLGEQLDRAGIGRGRLVFAMPRGDVIVKRLKLPKGEGAGESELAGMVRLQMTRQLTMAVEGTSIDYVVLADGGSDQETPATVSILAAALPGERMLWCREVAKAAGCKVERVGLRASGLAALLAAASQRQGAPVMGVSAGLGSAEFAVVDDGQMAFARAADVGVDSEGEEPAAAGNVARPSAAQRIAVEAKRTWMSYRVSENAADVAAIVVPGEGTLATQIARECGTAADLPWRLEPLPLSVEFPRSMSELDRIVASPLVGLLAEASLARRTFDFAHPRKAPDFAALKRQRILLGVFAAIVVLGGGFVAALLRIEAMDKKLIAAGEHAASLQTEYARMLASDARLRHIEQWRSAKVDWVAHLAYLSEQMPDPRQALMNQYSGQLAAEVEFTPKDQRYDPKGWKLRQNARISIEGPVKQGGIAGALRERLIDSGVYSKVDTRGPDTPNQFSLDLQTALVNPAASSVKKPEPAPPRKEASR